MSKRRSSYVPIDRDMWGRRSWTDVTDYGPLTGWLAIYLMTAPGSNMAGIYEATLYDLCRHTRMKEADIKAALKNLEESGFCRYDWQQQWVWDRTAVQRFVQSKPSGSQIKGLQNILARLQESLEAPFIDDALGELGKLAPEIHRDIMADGWLHYADED